jgi:tetratricopeptide (TPR) repeat protein
MVRIGADNPDSYLLLGNASAAAGEYANAISAYEKSLEMSPDHVGALSGLAHNLKTLGRQDEAIGKYRECIKANPYFTQTYWSLANLKTFRFSDDEVESMEKLLEHPNIPEESRVHIYNALGLEYEGRDNFDKAFDYFRQCNEIKRAEEYYDPVATEDLHDRIIGMFDKDYVSRESAGPGTGAAPIFIVGLQRTGSTLLEQILASHSLVEGTHELSDLGRVVHQIPRMLKKQGRFPEYMVDVDANGFGEIGRAYLDRTSKYRTGQPFFTDKNPNKFAHVGLAHLILPDAIFINARRHPLDSCLGSYKQLFAKGQPFSYDLTDLAEFYIQYDRLMDHWHQVLPGKVLDVRYEDVVADLDTQVRRILDHCGLPFEDQCLRFHETDRAVQTASSEQVRRPIYSSSVNLWRHYEHHLQPTIDILAPLLRGLPEKDRPRCL